MRDLNPIHLLEVNVLSFYHYDKNHRQLSYRVVHIVTLDGSYKWEERKAGVTLHRV